MNAVQDARRIASVCVVGAGTVGLSAAIAFARSMPQISVTLVSVSPDPASLTDCLPGTQPAIRSFHALIGLDEMDLVQQGIATHRVGTRFARWAPANASFVHATGQYGRDANAVPFHQVWVRARRAGRAAAFQRYSMAAVLAEAGKFVHPQPDPAGPLGSFEYALRLDPDRYRVRLGQLAEGLPIDQQAGEVRGIERRSDGGISALLLSGERRIEADLYLDCTGPTTLVSPQLDCEFEDWSAWLPPMRIACSAEGQAVSSSCDTFTRNPHGWTFNAPLGDRQFMAEGYLPGETAPDGAFAVQPGRRLKPWCRNVLAIGSGAIGVDLVGQLNLHLAHSAIIRALSLLPGRDCHPLELREYNRQTEEEALRVRDFLALHYLHWDCAGWQAQPPPNSLADTLDQFEARGRLPFYEGETFDRHGWLAVLLGLGLLPRQTDPAALAVDPAAADAGMQRLADEFTRLAQDCPSYEEYLQHLRLSRA